MCEKDQICNSGEAGGGWTRLRTSAATSRRTRLRPRRELFPARPTPALPIACATKKTKTKTITKVKIKTKTKTKIKTNTKKYTDKGKIQWKWKGHSQGQKQSEFILILQYYCPANTSLTLTTGFELLPDWQKDTIYGWKIGEMGHIHLEMIQICKCWVLEIFTHRVAEGANLKE